MEQEVKYALDHHVLVVAAGGTSTESLAYPAGLPGVIAVAGLYPDGSIWANEKKETEAYSYAPGVDIYSTLPNNRYGFFSGNSMAAAYVSAIVALAIDGPESPGSISAINTDSIPGLKSTFSKSKK
jgi:subtilisin family serine protease